MPEIVSTLKDQCLQHIADLLKCSYWSLDYQGFKSLPSSLIDELMVRVIDFSYVSPLRCSDLELLIISERVTEFILEDSGDPVNVTTGTIASILNNLSFACAHLKRVKINVTEHNRRSFRTVTPALNGLLREAQNINFLESDIPFDLSVLRNSTKLEKLIINFEPNSHTYQFFGDDGELNINSSITYLRICETQKKKLNSWQIGNLLKCCTKLNYLNVNIAEALQWLHADEWNNGTLTHKYNIRSCSLGCITENASEIAVRITSETCPAIEELRLHVDSDGVISAINSLRNIKRLRLYWNPGSYGDYTKEVQILLEEKEFGQNLTVLKLKSFRNTDISSISACCPNLEYLCLKLCSSKGNWNATLPIRFPKLNTLIFEDCRSCIMQSEQIIQLLCSAPNLESIVFGDGISFTDYVLENTLIHNSLSKLTAFIMYRCELSVNSVRMLASTVRSLKYFGFSDSEIEDEVVAVFREINPQVEVDIQY